MEENKKVQVSFVIDDALYSDYKVILALERTRVTTDLVKYINNRVEEHMNIDKDLYKEYKNLLKIKGISADEDLTNYMLKKIDEAKK